jgi:hypothetical protein
LWLIEFTLALPSKWKEYYLKFKSFRFVNSDDLYRI